MPRLRDPRLRRGLAIVLLLVVAGVAVYQIGVIAWTSYQFRAATVALERYDYSLAREHLKSCLFFQPTDHGVLLLAAQSARRHGDFDEAIRHLRLAEKHGALPEAVAVEQRLLRVQAGDLTDTDDMVHFCTNHPKGPDVALILEAIIEGSLNAVKPAPAKWGVDLWLKRRPNAFDQAQGLLWRGRLYEFVQDFPQALADYQKAADLDPQRREAKYRLAAAFLRDDPHKAIPHLDWLRQRDPADAELRYLTARLHRSLGQPEEAGKLLDALLVSTPDKVPVLVERGRVALDLNRPQDAEKWLQHALVLAPDKRDVILAWADCMRLADRPEDAKRYQDKADEMEARLSKRFAELEGKK